MNELYILGKNSNVYNKKKYLIDIVFNDYQIIELRHNEIQKINKNSKVLVFAYSKKKYENNSISDYLIVNDNPALYFLSASSLSLLSLCFSYSRIKRKQLNYLISKGSNKNYLGIFGSFVELSKNGSYALVDDSIFKNALLEFKKGAFGVKINYKTINEGNTILNYIIYVLFGVILGSYILKKYSNSLYGYNDASLYFDTFKNSNPLNNMILTLVFIFSSLPLVLSAVIFLYVLR